MTDAAARTRRRTLAGLLPMAAASAALDAGGALCLCALWALAYALPFRGARFLWYTGRKSGRRAVRALAAGVVCFIAPHALIAPLLHGLPALAAILRALCALLSLCASCAAYGRAAFTTPSAHYAARKAR